MPRRDAAEHGDYDHRRPSPCSTTCCRACCGGPLPRRRPDPRRGLRLRLVPAEQDVRSATCPAPTATTATASSCIAPATRCACSATKAPSTTRTTTTSTEARGRGQARPTAPVRQVPHGRAAVHGDRLARRPQLRVPRPDLTETLGTPNAAAGRLPHRPAAQFSLDAYRKLVRRGPQAALRHRLRRRPRRRPTPEPELAPGAQRTQLAHRPRDRYRTARAHLPGPVDETALHAALDADDALLRQTAAQNLPLLAFADVERLAPLLSDSAKAVRMAAVSRLAAAPARYTQTLPASGL
jgi:hypothetical protein